MEVIHIDGIIPAFVKPVVTLGTFDGVHQGHVELLRTLRRRASEIGGTAIVITFDVPPRLVLQPGKQTMVLNTIDEKTAHIAAEGIDYILIITFTKEFAALSPGEFIKEYLCHRLGVEEVILGYDHLFGNGGTGSFELMKKLGKQYNFSVLQVPAFEYEGNIVSSSLIRKLITGGDMLKAASFLGYKHTLRGKVVYGNQLGRTIGFPTINIEPDDPNKLIPETGVYSLDLELRSIIYKGMGNIGFRPTLNNPEPRLCVEVHLFDFQEDVYGETVTLFFCQKIRDEIKFSGINELKAQLEIDKAMIQK